MLKAGVAVPIFGQVKPSAAIFVLDPKAPYATIVVLGLERLSIATIACGPERRFFPIPFSGLQRLGSIFSSRGLPYALLLFFV